MTTSTGTGDSPAPPAKQRSTRRLLLSLAAALGLAGAGAILIMNSPAKQTPAPAATVTSLPVDTAAAPDHVVAYYFHTTYRCVSCRKIEAYSKLAVETAFAGDLASGRLQWRTINIEDEGNEHFVEDYQLYTKSLILSDQRLGREVRWKNLTRVWELLGNEPAFVDYVQTETRAFLMDLP